MRAGKMKTVLQESAGGGLFEKFFQSSSDMIAYIDRFAVYRFANDRYCQYAGLQRHDLIGRELAQVTDRLLPDCVEPKVRAALEGKDQEVSFQVTDPSNAWQRVHATYTPDVCRDGRPDGIFVCIRDPQCFQEAHAHLQAAVDQGMEGFALHDEDGNFTYVNPIQAEMYGYEPSEILGRSWKLFYEADQIEQIEAEVMPRLMSDGNWRGELTGRKKDGEHFDVEVSLTLLKDNAGQPCGLACNCTDITERKISEAALRQLQKMDAIGQLTGGIAHDFNNLLAVIVGNLDLLLKHCEGRPELRRLVDQALMAADRGATLTQRLLAFSRKQSLQPKSLDLNQLLLSMQDMLQRTLGEWIEVRFAPLDDAWLCHADPGQLENAILNLALNARDAMPNGGTLRLAVRNEPGGRAGEDDRDYLVLTIADTGVGMSDEVQEHIFEPFYTTKDVGEGSGLGLSMVHGFANQSGGKIEVESELGEGTTIEVFLPKSEAEVLEHQDAHPKMASENVGQRVLLVEDDTDVLQITCDVLENLGYCVLTAGSGAEALDRLKAQSEIDLILCDVMLAGGPTGIEVAEQAVQIDRNIKVLLMSGYSTIGTKLDSPFDLICKPFKIAELQRKLETIFAH